MPAEQTAQGWPSSFNTPWPWEETAVAIRVSEKHHAIRDRHFTCWMSWGVSRSRSLFLRVFSLTLSDDRDANKLLRRRTVPHQMNLTLFHLNNKPFTHPPNYTTLRNVYGPFTHSLPTREGAENNTSVRLDRNMASFMGYRIFIIW